MVKRRTAWKELGNSKRLLSGWFKAKLILLENDLFLEWQAVGEMANLPRLPLEIIND